MPNPRQPEPVPEPPPPDLPPWYPEPPIEEPDPDRLRMKFRSLIRRKSGAAKAHLKVPARMAPRAEQMDGRAV